MGNCEDRVMTTAEIESLLERYRLALETIENLCDEEIKVRSAGVSEAKLKNMRVLSLLRGPRDIARSALLHQASDKGTENA